MGYALGVDLGTTYTAAATYRDGQAEIAALGNRSNAIPSVVLLREDDAVLAGEAATRRAVSEPGRVAREFKRRVGDTTPIFLGGSPYSAEQLMARLLGWVIGEAAAREGGDADHLAVCHPANWGPYKTDLLHQAVRLAGVAGATLLTEPEAAAIHYASQERVDTGDVVAVYDLGGGTFDAAVLRKAGDGFEILGEPEGVERLGGIDFDAAVMAHVDRSLSGKLAELDEDDPTAVAAVARLRQECVEAKEALSTDTDTTIPVLLPNASTEVRLVRSEFEEMIRPAVLESIAALGRGLQSAGIEPADVSTVLLVGGSSRIPLVAQMVGAEFGRPVAVDIHPKHAVALGAALAAAQSGGMAGATGPVASDAGTDDASGTAAVGVGVGAATGAVVGAAATGEIMAAAPAGEPVEGASADAPPTPPPPTPPSDPAGADPTVIEPVPAAGTAEYPPVAAAAAAGTAVGAASGAAGTADATGASAGAEDAAGGEDRAGPSGGLIALVVLLVIALVGGGVLFFANRDEGTTSDPAVVTPTVATPTTTAAQSGGGVAPPAPAPTASPTTAPTTTSSTTATTAGSSP